MEAPEAKWKSVHIPPSCGYAQNLADLDLRAISTGFVECPVVEELALFRSESLKTIQPLSRTSHRHHTPLSNVCQALISKQLMKAKEFFR